MPSFSLKDYFEAKGHKFLKKNEDGTIQFQSSDGKVGTFDLPSLVKQRQYDEVIMPEPPPKSLADLPGDIVRGVRDRYQGDENSPRGWGAFSRNFRSGFDAGLTGTLLKGVGVPSVADAPEAAPGAGVAGLVGDVTGFLADPAADLLGFVGGKAVNATFKTNRLFAKAESLAGKRVMGDVVAEASYNKALRQWAISNMARSTAHGAVTGATIGGVSAAFQGHDVVTAALIGAGLGGGLGGTVGGISTRSGLKSMRGVRSIKGARPSLEVFDTKIKALDEQIRTLRSKPLPNVDAQVQELERIERELVAARAARGEAQLSKIDLPETPTTTPPTRTEQLRARLLGEADPTQMAARTSSPDELRIMRLLDEGVQSTQAERLIKEADYLDQVVANKTRKLSEAERKKYGLMLAEKRPVPAPMSKLVQEAKANKLNAAYGAPNFKAMEALRAYEAKEAEKLQRWMARQEQAKNALKNGVPLDPKQLVRYKAQALEKRTKAENILLGAEGRELKQLEKLRGKLQLEESKSVLATAKAVEKVNKRIALVEERIKTIASRTDDSIAAIKAKQGRAKDLVRYKPAAAKSAQNKEISRLVAERRRLKQLKQEALDAYDRVLEYKADVGPYEFRSMYTQRAFKVAQAQAEKLVKDGIISEKEMTSYATSILTSLVSKLGKRPSEGLFNRIVLDAAKFVLPRRVADVIDRKYGTQVGRLVDRAMHLKASVDGRVADEVTAAGNMLGKLEQRGLSADDVTFLMEYVETMKNGGQAINPNSTQFRPEFSTRAQERGWNFTAFDVLKNFPELAELRQWYDRLAQERGIPYRAGYVKKQAREGGHSRTVGRQAGEELRRGEGYITYGRDVTDHRELITRYAQSSAREIYMREWLDDSITELNKMVLLRSGQREQDFLRKYVSDVFGGGTDKQIDSLTHSVIVKNKELVNELFKLHGVQPDDANALAELYQAVQGGMYHWGVASNPKQVLLNYLQPTFSLVPELGRGWVGKYHKNKEVQKLAASLDHKLGSVELEGLEEIGFSRLKTRLGTGARDLITLNYKPTRWLTHFIKDSFGAVEHRNRRLAFGAAYIKFKEQPTMDTLAHLLPSERVTVLRELEENGVEAAAQAFGIIQNYRSNYAYTVANRPEFYRQGIGKAVPFITWGLNNFDRVVGDIEQGDFKTLVRRLAIPFVGLGILERMFGYSLPGANPMSLENFLMDNLGQAAPAITVPIEAMSKSLYQGNGIGQAAQDGATEFLKTNTPYKMVDRWKKNYEKAQGNIPAAIFGFEKK